MGSSQSLLLLGSLLELLSRLQFCRKCSMLSSVGGDALVGVTVDHVVVLDAITSDSKQDDQPCDAGKFLSQPPCKTLDAVGTDMIVGFRPSTGTQHRERVGRECVARQLHF